MPEIIGICGKMVPNLSPVSVSLGKQNLSAFAEEWGLFLFFELFILYRGRRKWVVAAVFWPGVPGMEEPGGLQSMGPQRVRHD